MFVCDTGHDIYTLQVKLIWHVSSVYRKQIE